MQDKNMREFLDKKVYRTKKWKLVRKKIAIDRGMICGYCNKLILDLYNVHHIIELNYENYENEDVVFNEKNLMLLHVECHNKIHGKMQYTSLTDKNKKNVNYKNREELLKNKLKRKK